MSEGRIRFNLGEGKGYAFCVTCGLLSIANSTLQVAQLKDGHLVNHPGHTPHGGYDQSDLNNEVRQYPELKRVPLEKFIT